MTVAGLESHHGCHPPPFLKPGAVAVPTEGDPSRLQALALNELKSDARASREIFALQDHFTGDFVDIPLGDHESIIMNLFSMHDLYKVGTESCVCVCVCVCVCARV